MRERDSQVSRDVSVDVDAGLDDSVVESEPLGESVGHRESQESSGGIRSRLRKRAGSIVSPRGVGISLVLMIVGSLLFGAIPLLGTVGELLGIAAAGFVYGLGTDARRYFELLLAGALAGGGSVLFGNLLLALFGNGLSMVAFGAFGGALAGVIGHYFGRDMRRGLTRDLAE